MNTFLNLRYSLRSLKKNKFTLFINIFGFAVSLAFVIMVGLYINKEYSVDSFHVGKERIFRIDNVEPGNDDSPELPVKFAEDLALAFPEVEATTTISDGEINIQMPSGERLSQEVMFTDSSFFSVFSFELAEGDAGSALRTRKDVILSRSFANKLFGGESAVGKSLLMGADSMEYFTVSGVIEDFGNSHIKCPDVMMSVEYETTDKNKRAYYDGYYVFSMYIYAKAKEGSDLAAKSADMTRYFAEDMEMWFDDEVEGGAHLELVPLTEVYFSDRHGYSGFMRYNNRDFLNIMAITTLLVLVFAGINYLNLSVSQSGFRAKSAAIQRLLGCSKGDMFWGFISESVGICLVSGVLAVLLAWLLYPWFGEVMRTKLVFGDSVGWWSIVSFVGMILIIGALSGWVPATVISGFKPIDVTRGTFRKKSKSVYSKVLITFQYIITIVLLGCTAVIMQQIDYMQHSDLGFDAENVIAFSYDSNNFKNRQSVEQNLRAVPGVESVSSCSAYPTSYISTLMYEDRDGGKHSVQRFRADSNFVSVLGLSVVCRHQNNGYWFNETMAGRIGLTEEMTAYKDKSLDVAVKGLVRDFHLLDFSRPIGEVWIEPVGDDYIPQYILVRVAPDNRALTLKRIAEEYERLGGVMFDGMFISDHVKSLYADQRRLSVILMLLSFVAIVISSMGMLAMSIYFTRQRARDMAVRKVFGATPRGVLGMLMGGFLKLVGVAFVIAVPVIYLLMQEWLSGYVYRIKLTPVPFLVAGGVVLVIAVLTVVGHSVKVAMSNPVDSLKAE